MTSISQQPVVTSQILNNSSPSVDQTPSPQSSTAETAISQTAPPSSGRNFANASRKPTLHAAPSTAVYGKLDTASPMNGKNPIAPAVPALGTPTIVNGNALNAVSSPSDHSRKVSVTISAAGASGQMPNGGPVAGKPSGGNGLVFGSVNANASPALSSTSPYSGPPGGSLAPSNSNPRITSPQTSPSPIPQPPASGGRPPSTLLGQGTVNFGSLAGDDASRQLRPGMSSGSLTPGIQAAHLRRDSSQSGHNEMSNVNRGGYPQQGGRGRGYANQYQHQQQMPYSPNPSYRPPPNAPRSSQNMGQQFAPQGGRPMNQNYPHSPHQVARSPSLASSQPIHPQQGQMPMQSPQIPTPVYGNYQPQMVPQQAQYGMQQGFDPYTGFYSPYGMPPQMQHYNMAAPASPRPPYNMPQTQPQYVPGQYNHQPQSMSRTSSAVSDRPPSTVGQPQTPMTPAVSHISTASRGAPSPAPKLAQFQIPVKRSAGIVIKDPNSGAVKTFEKPPATPAVVPKSHSPAIVTSSTPPPPRTPSQADSHHSRTDSKATKTADEMKRDLKDAVARKIKADEEEEKRKKEEEESKLARAQEEAESRAAQEKDVQTVATKEESDSDEVAKNDQDEKPEDEEEDDSEDEEEEDESEDEEPVGERALAEGAHVQEKELKIPHDDEEDSDPSKASDSGKVPDLAVADVPGDDSSSANDPVDEAEAEKLRKEKEEDEYWARIEAEELEKERLAEEAYQKKKASEREEQARRAAEAAAQTDDDLKRQEREMEEAEEARLKNLEGNEDDDKKARQDLFAALRKDDASLAGHTAADDTPAESGTATPVSDSSAMPPPRAANGSKQKPAALKLKTTEPVEAPQPSAALQSLRSARFLTTISDATYPPAIASPNPALNHGAAMGKFRYDKTFLLQFQPVFVEKPSETWNERVKETVGDTSDTPGGRTKSNATMQPRSGSVRGTGPSSGAYGAVGGFGNFQRETRTVPPGATAMDRNQTMGRDKAGVGGPSRFNASAPGSFPMGFNAPAMTRTPSSTSIGHPGSPRGAPSHRGSGGRGSQRGRGPRDGDKDILKMPLTAGLDVKPIEVSATGWKPRSIGQNAAGMAGPPPGGDGYLAPDVVQRKVKAALNKMTPSTFDKISAQIIDIVDQSKKETDGRTLRQVIQLTFEKATDEAHWAQMYAKFCSRMLENMTSEIKDETLGPDKSGNIPSGGTLFRKYLLNRCQQDFEAGWKAKLPDKPEGGETEEAVMLSDEYYIAAAAKRRGLGLVRFIGELYKLGMLTSRIMHMCVKRLVDFEGMPDEAEVESLTSLLKTIGENLDNEEKGRPSMDAYFDRINAMIKLDGLPSRLQFMLMDIVDLRRRGWKTKDNAAKGPATLEEIRAQVAAQDREKEAQRAADSRRGGGGGGRPPIGRGDARNFSGGNQFMPPPQNTVGIDDIRRLGRGGSRQASGQNAPMSLGPTSMFNTRGSNTGRRTMALLGRTTGEDSGASSRTATPPAQREKKEREEKEAATHVNAFSALAALDPETADPTSPPSSASSPPIAKARTILERTRSKSPLPSADAGDEAAA